MRITKLYCDLCKAEVNEEKDFYNVVVEDVLPCAGPGVFKATGTPRRNTIITAYASCSKCRDRVKGFLFDLTVGGPK